MKLWYLFGCLLAAGSLLVFPELGLAHGGGGGGHGFGGGGGGRGFGGFSRVVGGRGFGPGFRGVHGLSDRRFSDSRGFGRFDGRGFRGRGRDFRRFEGDFFDFGFYGFGYPDYPYYGYPYPYYYPYGYSYWCVVQRSLSVANWWSNMIKIAIIAGSTRPSRNGEAVAKWIYEVAKKRSDAEFELVDINPILNSYPADKIAGSAPRAGWRAIGTLGTRKCSATF
jgi:NADPH-dependent FMN reductase